MSENSWPRDKYTGAGGGAYTNSTMNILDVMVDSEQNG